MSMTILTCDVEVRGGGVGANNLQRHITIPISDVSNIGLLHLCMMCLTTIWLSFRVQVDKAQLLNPHREMQENTRGCRVCGSPIKLSSTVYIHNKATPSRNSAADQHFVQIIQMHDFPHCFHSYELLKIMLCPGTNFLSFCNSFFRFGSLEVSTLFCCGCCLVDQKSCTLILNWTSQ